MQRAKSNRMPIQAWQYMEATPGGGLNAAYFSQYDAYVQEIIRSGAHVILDLHSTYNRQCTWATKLTTVVTS
jgi:hypothetical protein